jgi:hypothetical protein
MKRLIQLFMTMGAVAVASVCAASEIQIGDSLTTVIASLGEPEGLISDGRRTLLYYERGRVDLADGKVVSASLISPEQAEARRVAQLRADALARQVAEEQRARRIAEGTALLQQKLSDPGFLTSPASYRVAFWQTFQRNYPEVSVGDDYAAALREQQADEAARLAEAERAQQMAELEQRAAEAEQRAAAAD